MVKPGDIFIVYLAFSLPEGSCQGFMIYLLDIREKVDHTLG